MFHPLTLRVVGHTDMRLVNFSYIFKLYFNTTDVAGGTGWLNELDSWIT